MAQPATVLHGADARQAPNAAITRQLANIYYASGDPGSYGGAERLFRRAREIGIAASRKRVDQFLRAQQAYTLHRPVRHRFIRNKTYVAHIDQQWQADLADMQQLSSENNGFRYLVTCIDVLSKFAWVEPVKTKRAVDVCRAFRVILRRAHPRKPQRIQTDKGTEFFNSDMRTLFRAERIHHFASESDQKAAVCERFNRTLKTRLWVYFTANNTRRYTNILQDIVYAYNHSPHRSIGMHPADCDNPVAERAAWKRLYYDTVGRKHARCNEKPTSEDDNKAEAVQQEGGRLSNQHTLKPGALVRISKWKGDFEKGYMPNWSREHFVVTGVQRHPQPVYKLVDADNEALEGTFYQSEVQPITRNIYEFERIVKERRQYRRPAEILVKWKGLPAKFNRWVLKRDLKKYQQMRTATPI